MRDDIVDNRVVTTFTWRSEVQMNVQSTTRDPQESTRPIRTWIFWWTGTRTSIGHAAGHHHLWRHRSVIDVRHIGAFACVRPSREERLMSCSRCTAKYETSCFEYRREFIADVSYTKIQKMSHVIRVIDAHRRRSVDVCSDLLECDRRDWHDERTYIRNTWTIVGPDSMEDVFVGTTYPNDMTQRQRSVGRSRVMSFQSEDFHRRLGRRIPFVHVQHAFFFWSHPSVWVVPDTKWHVHMQFFLSNVSRLFLFFFASFWRRWVVLWWSAVFPLTIDWVTSRSFDECRVGVHIFEDEVQLFDERTILETEKILFNVPFLDWSRNYELLQLSKYTLL